MKFTKIVGKVDAKLVEQAEEKLTSIFLELATKYDNEHIGSKLGGDIMIFVLMQPTEHICTLNMPTAATDGKRFYWNPKFVLKQSRIGLRLLCGHEAWHALYMHPSRRGSRHPRLWNIAVDYIVNGTVMEDLKARKKDPVDLFKKNLGNFKTLKEYMDMLKDPFGKLSKSELDASASDYPICDLPKPDEDRELTVEEQKELERREKASAQKFFFADPDLDDDTKRPEKIYDMLYQLVPKCAKCGKIGMYQLPKKDDKNKGKKIDKKEGQEDKQDAKSKNKGKQKGKGDKSDQKGDQHDHGEGQECSDGQGDQSGEGEGQGDQPGQGQGQSCDHGGCSDCDGGIDVFGLGGTVDEHMDTEESEEKLAKRISEAMETARKMAGKVPAALEDELGKLVAPRVTWQDILRTRLLKARAGNGRNDWTRFRTRPMFSGLLIPKRKSYFANFGALLDTSGSMSADDLSFGISQLAGLDDKAEGTVVPCDAQCYWENATKIKKCNVEELSKVKVVGRGGTCLADFFENYEKHLGKCDFLVVMTDGYLLDSDVAAMRKPDCDVYWIITSGALFKAPFGKICDLRG